MIALEDAYLKSHLNSHRHRVMISADDFGISRYANSNTLYLIMLGKIDRVGLMTYGKIYEEEIKELARSRVKLDIHLDVLHKFNEEHRKRTGVVFRVIEFMAKRITGKLSNEEVEADWTKQIEKFRKMFGKNPDGISSHEHVHFYPPFFKIALKLQAKYSIPYIRFGESTLAEQNKPAARILHWLKIVNRKNFRENGYVSSESFTNLDWIKDIEGFINNLPKGITEIACHPEVIDDFEKIKKYF
ncbi:MAG TPA: ChbG/HpnK family deacetylase [Candidatus Moranbacteria bacterium]|nr:ChbG/HpnK family deacetylase [Candidatus Moranbacteria bacterium]HRZ34082.1 ChbG/HpnK family deacetylase [Candidatus Moranbacteria bacterium]